ncbi:MAG: MBL fold metallo-hydrolase [Gemmataceae bacterium]|nr:MBL fold metallo-hydrolase [Gemmataceae bacterium]
MAATVTVLASGSAGNAALVRDGGFGLLIDCGLAARTLSQRLSVRGMGWRHVDAVILTHTHGDHWTRSALSGLYRHRVALWCHPAHAADIERAAPREWSPMHAAGLVRYFAEGDWAMIGADVRAMPRRVNHDAEPTFSFRIEGATSLFGAGWSVGYASDLGEWDAGLADLFAGVDLLAAEFNHDVPMQRNSRRSAHLIQRVLGPRGHLSNEQGADFAKAVQERCGSPLRSLIPLHRSRECNTTELVDTAARDSLLDPATVVHLAHQNEPTPTIDLVPQKTARSVSMPRRTRSPSATPTMFE